MGTTVVADSASWKSRTYEPLLSAIVPVHNTAPYVIAALNSLIPTEVEQVEIIVVHDGGTDEALPLVREWIDTTPVAARLLDQPNRGLAATRTTGLQHATGRMLSFLDSDDIADAEVRLRMARDCEDHQCDIVIGRSAVLDDSSLTVDYFPDALVWNHIMSTFQFRRTTLVQEPRLLRLEPNTSQRVIRRRFFHDAGLRFPEGRKFEDTPPHVRGMIRASAVGLRNETAYLYRVNNPGKMTDERNPQRLDGIAVVGEGLTEALAKPVTVDAGANLAIQATRMLVWHGEHVSNPHKQEFVDGALELGKLIPVSWYKSGIETWAFSDRERLLLGVFWYGKPRILKAIIDGRYPHIHDGLAFALRPSGRVFRKIAAKRIATLEPLRRLVRD